MDRALLILDGAYVDYMTKAYSSIRLDYGKLATSICEQFQTRLWRAVYLNCLPYLPQNPTPQELLALKKKEGFYKKIELLPNFDVKLGYLTYRGVDDRTGKGVFEQKQVDVLIAVEMVYAAARRSVDAVILLSGDGDFVPAIDVVKREGLKFYLAYWKGSIFNQDATAQDVTSASITIREDLKIKADDSLLMTKEFLETLQREG